MRLGAPGFCSALWEFYDSNGQCSDYWTKVLTGTLLKTRESEYERLSNSPPEERSRG